MRRGIQRQRPRALLRRVPSRRLPYVPGAVSRRDRERPLARWRRRREPWTGSKATASHPSPIGAVPIALPSAALMIERSCCRCSPRRGARLRIEGEAWSAPRTTRASSAPSRRGSSRRRRRPRPCPRCPRRRRRPRPRRRTPACPRAGAFRRPRPRPRRSRPTFFRRPLNVKTRFETRLVEDRVRVLARGLDRRRGRRASRDRYGDGSRAPVAREALLQLGRERDAVDTLRPGDVAHDLAGSASTTATWSRGRRRRAGTPRRRSGSPIPRRRRRETTSRRGGRAGGARGGEGAGEGEGREDADGGFHGVPFLAVVSWRPT